MKNRQRKKNAKKKVCQALGIKSRKEWNRQRYSKLYRAAMVIVTSRIYFKGELFKAQFPIFHAHDDLVDSMKYALNIRASLPFKPQGMIGIGELTA